MSKSLKEAKVGDRVRLQYNPIRNVLLVNGYSGEKGDKITSLIGTVVARLPNDGIYISLNKEEYAKNNGIHSDYKTYNSRTDVGDAEFFKKHPYVIGCNANTVIGAVLPPKADTFPLGFLLGTIAAGGALAALSSSNQSKEQQDDRRNLAE